MEFVLDEKEDVSLLSTPPPAERFENTHLRNIKGNGITRMYPRKWFTTITQ
jgi:hypothetical protein